MKSNNARNRGDLLGLGRVFFVRSAAGFLSVGKACGPPFILLEGVAI
jgi:hypothetical protein